MISKTRALRRLLSDHFSQEELRTLCYDLDVDYDNLRGESKVTKGRELVAYLQRRNRLDDLVAYLEEDRPDLRQELEAIRQAPTRRGVRDLAALPQSYKVPFIISVVVIGTAGLIVLLLFGSRACTPPLPSPSPAVTESPTPTEPTPSPTASPTPSPTPTLPPTPCAVAVYGAFSNVWEEHVDQLGCPSSAEKSDVWIGQQDFQRGRMFWREDNDKIYVLYNDDRWERYDNLWSENDPEYTCGTPQSPPTPKRGFGQVWCTHDDVQQGLGDATNSEWGEHGTVQEFSGDGLILQTGGGRIYVFCNDGTWSW